MLVEVKVPVLAESVAEATLMSWHKKPGDRVSKGDSLIDIETDKVTLEIASLNDGVLTEIIKEDGAIVTSDEVIARIDTDAAGQTASADTVVTVGQDASAASAPLAGEPPRTGPAVRNMVAEKELDLRVIPTSTPGRVSKEDVVNYLEQRQDADTEDTGGKPAATPASGDGMITTTAATRASAPTSAPATASADAVPAPATPASAATAQQASAPTSPAPAQQTPAPATAANPAAAQQAPAPATAQQATAPAAAPANTSGATPDTGGPGEAGKERTEQRVPMTRLRRRAAERLLTAQQENAILSTFNEVNMEPVMTLRGRYKEEFEQQHKVKLGFMSFFTRAVVEALKKFPVINASVEGEDILYHNYFDIGIAVSAPRGLVVPIVRDADLLSLSDIEQTIRSLSSRARDNKLAIDDLTGGTFTITNGGVFGSLLSTPIINPPQSAILGMHKIQERPVVEDGQVVVRPMMYLALSYDHRIIDGSEAVQFLVAIKTQLEDPARMLLQL